MSHQMTWSHYVELLKLNDINEMNYYIEGCVKQHLTIRSLREKIKTKEYKRLDDKTKYKLITKDQTNITDFVKNPILIKSSAKDILNEKSLKEIILSNISDFMKELGNSFSFVDTEYRIKIGNNYNYIDLLLYNIEFNCYVVIELKVTELKKEHIGQIEVYMNYIDENIKKINQDKTIGIIICKEDNKYIIKYCSDKRIFTTKYISI